MSDGLCVLYSVCICWFMVHFLFIVLMSNFQSNPTSYAVCSSFCLHLVDLWCSVFIHNVCNLCWFIVVLVLIVLMIFCSLYLVISLTYGVVIFFTCWGGVRFIYITLRSWGWIHFYNLTGWLFFMGRFDSFLYRIRCILCDSSYYPWLTCSVKFSSYYP